MLLPVMARSAEIDYRRLIKQETVVGRMGSMTGRAVPLLYRRMFCLGPRLSLDGIVVARAAQRDHRGLQQLDLRRGMRVMAAQAALPAYHRPMHLVLSEYVVHRIVMAAPAQLVPRLLRCERGSGRGLLMALVAHFIRDRPVDIIIEDPSPVGAVGIMTGRAARIRHRVVHMLLHEGGAVRLMARKTESGHRILEEGSGLARTVRAVTPETSLLDRGVLEFRLLYPLPHLFVAVETEIVPRLQEIEPAVCSVRIMALQAAAFRHDLVRALRLLRHHVRVAAAADLALFSSQHLPVG